jgi:GNAT superfamily N-acetyltransferase
MLANVDDVSRLALVVEPEACADDVVGVARYEPTDRPDTVEVAFVVQDGWQNRGLGTVLLGDLLRVAAARGIRRFRAWVLADNTRMLDLLNRFTTITERKLEHGVVEVTFAIR